MNELQAKLNKRRSVVEESGLKFESEPAAHPQGVTVTHAPASPYRTYAAPPAVNHSGGGDFLAAINRRRATVDGDGETFESTPSVKTADAAASTPVGVSPAGHKARHGMADFRTAIDQQRAKVDGGADNWESKPAQRTADCASSLRSETMQSGVEAKPRMEDKSMEEAQIKESTEEPTDEPADHDVQDDLQDDQDDQDDELESPSHGKEAVPVRTTLTAARGRVSWLIRLGQQLEEEYVTDFALSSFQPVQLRLQPSEQGCRLSLHAPEGASDALEVKLFVGKGWKKKGFRTWRTTSPLVEDFATDLTHRSSVLCGAIFKEEAWLEK
ncbi:unnamed protein product [Effrenium voratum]|uniref:Uncharacterized protein n=1 Tax=Effrenium voratum TaxID=2562239 RepID=A0AA36HNT6_9DINO|nr:unnamed protein product [Effrenium voratum]CAJ1372522.1 unnamed protein product [Effrenium voratum]CAJ1428574.1 unnamed protein product [Effrenium voratum]